MRSRLVTIATAVFFAGASSARAQQLGISPLVEETAASVSQAAGPVWRQSAYRHSPPRELAFSASLCDAGGDGIGRGGGITYTRNLADDAALEAVVDVGFTHRMAYDARTNDFRAVGAPHPFGLIAGQFRAARERMPGLKEYLTIGVARVFGDGAHAAWTTGRAVTVGAGLRGALGSTLAIRLDLQALFFDTALGARASAGIAVGLD
jgi:hypothetical protein